jgi:opacity protein-like surface antigen
MQRANRSLRLINHDEQVRGNRPVRIKGIVMRSLLSVLCLLGLATQAAAGDLFDMPTLRGSSPYVPAPAKYARWNGFYVGGQFGQGSATFDFAGATESLISYLLRTTHLEREQRPSEWGVLGKSYSTNSAFGGFIGYNTTWQDTVVGIDIHYNRSDFFNTAPVTPITRAVSAGGNSYVVTVNGDASMRIIDYGSARVRAGWMIGNFLPYAAGGVAVGRADISRSAQVSGAENPPTGYPFVPCDPLTNCVEFSFSSASSRKAAFIYGWSAGVGVDVLLMPNLFLRGEYEYVQFAKIQGMKASLNTARVGAGLKF